jgi:hypothetical protein
LHRERPLDLDTPGLVALCTRAAVESLGAQGRDAPASLVETMSAAARGRGPASLVPATEWPEHSGDAEDTHAQRRAVAHVVPEEFRGIRTNGLGHAAQVAAERKPA